MASSSADWASFGPSAALTGSAGFFWASFATCPSAG